MVMRCSKCEARTRWGDLVPKRYVGVVRRGRQVVGVEVRSCTCGAEAALERNLPLPEMELAGAISRAVKAYWDGAIDTATFRTTSVHLWAQVKAAGLTEQVLALVVPSMGPLVGAFR